MLNYCQIKPQTNVIVFDISHVC